MKKARRVPRGGYEVAAFAAYNRRNAVVRRLGFADYDAYLASPLWAEIRDRKLASEGRRCFACGKEAGQVHHGGYRRETLRGPELVLTVEGAAAECSPAVLHLTWDLWLLDAELYVVCKTDHEWAEYYLGAKLPPEVATRRLKNRRKKNRLDETVPRAARQGRQERKAREMSNELARLLERDEHVAKG